MPQPHFALMRLFWAGFCMLWLTVLAQGDPLPALGLKERQNWHAIGIVNASGYRGKASCTGALIAPDLVLTAAHCAGKQSQSGRKRHFVAGWDRGSFVAHRLSAETLVHPKFHGATGTQRFLYDIALLRLETPISVKTARPFTPSTSASLRLGTLSVVGYHRKRANVINGRFDCDTLPRDGAGLVLLDCEVISGNSGAPVLTQVGDDWMVVAVVAGRIGGQHPRALAVPLDEWVIGHWQQAQLRAEAKDNQGCDSAQNLMVTC